MNFEVTHNTQVMVFFFFQTEIHNTPDIENVSEDGARQKAKSIGLVDVREVPPIEIDVSLKDASWREHFFVGLMFDVSGFLEDRVKWVSKTTTLHTVILGLPNPRSQPVRRIMRAAYGDGSKPIDLVFTFLGYKQINIH